MEKVKVSYDEEFDDLYVYKADRKAKFSIELDELVIDIDSANNVSGVEIMDASSMVSQLSPETVGKEGLRHISGAEIITRQKGNSMMVMMMLHLKEKSIERRIPINIAMPTVR